MFSHGPRQGIYQPMESFRSPNWRASQTTSPGQVYRYTCVIAPPNSFPARSLVKRQVLSPHSQVPSPRPHDPATAATHPHSRPPSSAHLPYKHAPNSPPLLKRTPSSKNKPKRAYPSSLSTAAIQMHARSRPLGSISKEKYHRTCTRDFLYPDPITFKEQSPFSRRLARLTELESETVKQEIFNHFSSRTTNSSASSVSRASTATEGRGGVERAVTATGGRGGVERAVTATGGRGGVERAVTGTGGRGGVERVASREGRAKSARTSRGGGGDTMGIGRHASAKKTTRVSSHANGDFPGTQSLFNLCTPSETTSASDLEMDMGSLSLGVGVAARGSGGKEQPRHRVSARKKGYLSKSVSSCSIGRGRSKSASKHPRSAAKY